MKILRLVLTFTLASLLAGCGSSSSSPSTPTLQKIQVTPATPSVAAGLQQQFKAMGVFSDSSTQDLTSTATWSSSSSNVATVASNGLATSKAQGSTTISAASSGVTGTATLTVTAPNLVSIAVTPANATQSPATFQQYTATGTYTDSSTQNLTSSVTWSSTTPAVAGISTGGFVTAATLGSTTIQAVSGSVTGNTGLTVATPTLESIQLSGENLTIAPKTSHQYAAYGIYSDGGKRVLPNTISSQVTWMSSNASFASISALGLAEGLTAGSTTISATVGSVSKSTTLTVSSATLNSIVVGPTTRTIAPLTLLGFTAVGTFSDSTTQDITNDVTWTSSAPAAFQAGRGAGIVTAISMGPATITATLGVSGTALLQVSSATPSSSKLTAPTTSVAAGSAFGINAVGTFSDSTNQEIGAAATWMTSDATVATVSNTGFVNAVAPGSATITATLGGVSNNLNLTVENMTALAMMPASATVAPNTVANFQAVATLTDSSTQNVSGSSTFTSATSAVALSGDASNTHGQVFAQAPGSSVIGGVFSGIVTSSTVTVTSATLQSIAITPANPTVALNAVQTFKATGTFSDGTTQVITNQVTWTSSDVATAIISPIGVATPTGSGTSTITAQLNGVSGTTVMTVP